ncbi:RIC1 C-terminal alpha solenoid region domain-containing protein [Entamoeba marina]
MLQTCYTHLSKNFEKYQLSKIRANGVNLLTTTFEQPFDLHFEIIAIITDVSISIVSVTANEFTIYPAFIHHIQNIHLSHGFFLHNTSTFYLHNSSQIFCFSVDKRDPSSLPLTSYRPTTPFYLYPKQNQVITYNNPIENIYQFDNDILVSLTNGSFSMLNTPTNTFLIDNQQSNYPEDIDPSFFSVSNDQQLVLYKSTSGNLICAFLLEGTSIPIIHNTVLIGNNFTHGVFAHSYYFAVVDVNFVIHIYQYSLIHRVCSHIKTIQPNTYSFGENVTSSPIVRFLPNDNILIQFNDCITVSTIDGIMTNMIHCNGNVVIDSNGCRLWESKIVDDVVIVQEYELINTIQQGYIFFQYTKNTISVIPDSIHTTKKLINFTIPQLVLKKKYHSIQKICIYPIQDTYFVVIQQSSCLVVFDFSTQLLKTIQIDLLTKKECIQWVFTKGLFTLIQIIAPLLHITVYKFPNFTTSVYDNLESIPQLNSSPYCGKFTFSTDKLSPTYYIHPNEALYKFDPSHPIKIGDDSILTQLDDGLSLFQLTTPTNTNSNSNILQYPEIQTINNENVLLVDVLDDMLNTLIISGKKMGFVTWKFVYRDSLFSIQHFKTYPIIQGELSTIQNSFPLNFKVLFCNDDTKVPKSLIIHWSNFLLTTTPIDTTKDTSILSENVHSFTFPFTKILMIQQPTKLIIRHLDYSFHSFDILTTLPLLTHSPPYIPIIVPPQPHIPSTPRPKATALVPTYSFLSINETTHTPNALSKPTSPRTSFANSKLNDIYSSDLSSPFPTTPSVIFEDISKYSVICNGIKEYNYLGEIVLIMLTNNCNIKPIEEKYCDNEQWDQELSKALSRIVERYHNNAISFTLYETIVNYIIKQKNSHQILLKAACMIESDYYNELFEISDSPINIFYTTFHNNSFHDAFTCLSIIHECYGRENALQCATQLIKKLVSINEGHHIIPKTINLLFLEEQFTPSDEEIQLKRYLEILLKNFIHQLLEKNDYSTLYLLYQQQNPFLLSCFACDTLFEIDVVDGLKKAINFVKLNSFQVVLSFGKHLLQCHFYIHTLLLGISSKLKNLVVFDGSYYYLELLVNKFRYHDESIAHLIKKVQESAQTNQSTLLTV